MHTKVELDESEISILYEMGMHPEEIMAGFICHQKDISSSLINFKPYIRLLKNPSSSCEISKYILNQYIIYSPVEYMFLSN